MKISTKGRYALRIMIDLAENANGEYIRLKDISARQGITLKYMEQIMPILTKAGYVKSFRGNNGGYMLAKKPEEYKLRPHIGLIFALFFCILHSFYFFPSCFVAGILYICHLLPDYLKQIPAEARKKTKHKIWWNYIVDVSFAVAMNLFLLLPTGLAILGNKKDTGAGESLFKILRAINGKFIRRLIIINLHIIFQST